MNMEQLIAKLESLEFVAEDGTATLKLNAPIRDLIVDGLKMQVAWREMMEKVKAESQTEAMPGVVLQHEWTFGESGAEAKTE